MSRVAFNAQQSNMRFAANPLVKAPRVTFSNTVPLNFGNAAAAPVTTVVPGLNGDTFVNTTLAQGHTMSDHHSLSEKIFHWLGQALKTAYTNDGEALHHIYAHRY